MINSEKLSPVTADLELLNQEAVEKIFFEPAEVRKLGPVRVSLQEIDWARLEAIKPYPESPIHD